ncbi:esterase-like activity of phytase family protein [Chaetoceros tenuissimus]|uniref:Esterase-like activity of phytase family protein n=1 Tax=Chaetoceros tenuissimus TaxID=426638 RepID=A0AAD3H5V9_9STRA|nr:esterase-like activity of phytase family protein [Chaetoceros tenuissimus]
MDLDAAISETQHTLQQIFSKPKCTEKLLRRPPLRYLADVVRATIAKKGFPAKYYSKEEFDFENKDAKLAFLEKLFHLVGVCQGKKVQVKASSIIAGVEVVDTLQLLNSFGKIALDEKFPHDEAVAHCLSGGTIESFPSFDAVNKDAESFSNDKNIQSDLKKQIRNCTGDLTQTKYLLNSVISKPRCSTKLLEKPPLRFIHDVVIAIASAEDMDLTKVLSESELNSSNVKEKEAKIAFLIKLIDHVEKRFSLQLDMNPSRIVAGKDAEKTRKLLQLFVTLAKNERMHSEDHDNLPNSSFGGNTIEFQIPPTVNEANVRDNGEVKVVAKEDSLRDIINNVKIGDDKNVEQSIKEMSPSDAKEVIENIGEKMSKANSNESKQHFFVNDDVQLDKGLESNGARPMTATGRPRTAVHDYVEDQDIIEDLVDAKVPILKARPFLASKLNESSSEESEQETDEEEGRVIKIGSRLRSTVEKTDSPPKQTYSFENNSSTLQRFAKTACAIVPETVAVNSSLEELQLELVEQQSKYQEGLNDLEVSMKQTEDIMTPLHTVLAETRDLKKGKCDLWTKKWKNGKSSKGKGSYNFNRIATFPVCSQLDADCNTDTETAAEIVTVSGDLNTLIYSDSPMGVIGFVDITDATSPSPLGTLDVGGEPTSVSVWNDSIAVVGVNTSEDYVNTSGLLVAVDIATQTILKSWDLGGQPDSVAVSPDGKYIVVAIENERDEDLGDGIPPQMPAGFVVSIATAESLDDWTPSVIDVTGLDGVNIPEDPEPEFVHINENNLAVVTLQENNAIILIDLESGTVESSFSAGSVDLDNIDTEEEGIIDQTSSLDAVPREPDGVVFMNPNYFATADEGDMDGGSRGFTI